MKSINTKVIELFLISMIAIAMLIFSISCSGETSNTSGTSGSTPPPISSAETPTPVVPSSPAVTMTPTPVPASPATSSSNPSASVKTFGELAASGKSVFSNNCAVCHGENGGGTNIAPGLWGSGATLGKYGGSTIFASNARAMLGFISTRMPFTAPGSLSHQQYLDVLCYILIQGNQVSSSTTFNESHLSTITLK